MPAAPLAIGVSRTHAPSGDGSVAGPTRLEFEACDGEKVQVPGEAPPFREALALARRVARTDASVFLTGESGSGKELFAQFIHRHSHRASAPFLPLNCAALPEALLESEMFGHRRGAFTGAVRDKAGLLEAANDGTVFLDEVTEMATMIQAKLLRVIQDGVVRRVGSESADAVVNVRFIAATNRDPEAAVASGLLRKDLYFRLRVVPIHVPPLRERPEDIPLLASTFLSHYWRKHRHTDTPPPTLTKSALRALAAHPWPGNVRELQNVIEHTVVLLDPGTAVKAAHLPFVSIPRASTEASLEPGVKEDNEGYYVARDRLLATFERTFITRAMLRAGGNVSKAARLTAIDRTTFYRMLERHGMQRRLAAAQP